jgi:hypothetical protein
MTVSDNRAELVAVAVRMRVSEPRLWLDRPSLGRDGRRMLLPGCGGVALGVHAGDPVDRFLGDHLMPGISLEDLPGASAHGLVCAGNRVRRLDGTVVGTVAGKRGGLAPGAIPAELIGVEASDDALLTIVPRDEVVVEAYGRGLALDRPSRVEVMNCSPETLDALHLSREGDRLSIEVRAVFPSVLAGPGVGSDTWIGDLEIAVPAENVPGEPLHFGDIVAFADIDARIIRFHREGYVTIGVVSHGPSPVAGHGVGVTTFLSGPEEVLAAHIREHASIAAFLCAAVERVPRYRW